MVVGLCKAICFHFYAFVWAYGSCGRIYPPWLPHLCLSGHVSMQSKLDVWDPTCPKPRAVPMMLAIHRTLGSHNSCDKASQLSLTQAESAVFGHDRFDHNRVWSRCYSCCQKKIIPIVARDCSRGADELFAVIEPRIPPGRKRHCAAEAHRALNKVSDDFARKSGILLSTSRRI